MLNLPANFETYAEARKSGFMKMKEIKDNGGRIVGVYCSFVPQELLMAAGAAAGAGADPTDSQSAAVRGTLHGAVRRAELRQSRVSGGLRRKNCAQGRDGEANGLYAPVRKRPQPSLGRQSVPSGGQGPDSAPDETKIRFLRPC